MAELQREVHAAAQKKGWWDNPDRNVGELLMLVCSEVAEAMEEFRKSGDPRALYHSKSAESPLMKPEGFGVELADAVIRIMDICERFNLDLQTLIEAKMAYNATRTHLHGGRYA